MSSEEKKSPYFSTRVRIGTLTTLKHFGFKEVTVEVTYGNQDAIMIRNEKDVAQITDNIPLQKKIWDLLEEVVKEGKDRGYKFAEVEES